MPNNQSPKDQKSQMRPAMYAAEYGYLEYPSKFSDKYFGEDMIERSVSNIKRYLTREEVRWGNYQKYAPDNPFDDTRWPDPELYKNWESAVDEAREDLAKFPAPYPGPDPDVPGRLADNLQDHLDKAVRIALFDKYMPNAMESGVPIKVKVYVQPKKWRRHGVSTEWKPSPYLHLEITMVCPNGGWIGTALWKKYNHFQLGRVAKYSASYLVPEEPRENHGQILFIFNGAESLPSQTSTPAILQPVLQWTNEAGPRRWAVRSWYVPASYTPSFDDMPPRDNMKPFDSNDLTQPAWTVASPVDVGDRLEGVINWDGTKYVSSFLRNGQEMARLEVPGIAPLIFPVAVIEAYMPPEKGKPWPRPVPKKGLVDVNMTGIGITPITSNVAVTPDWDVGREDPGQPHKYGTNRLKRYKVTPDYGRVPITSLSFKVKSGGP